MSQTFTSAFDLTSCVSFCPCQNCSQGPPAEKTGRGSLLNRPSCPPGDAVDHGTELNWTVLLWFLLLTPQTGKPSVLRNISRPLCVPNWVFHWWETKRCQAMLQTESFIDGRQNRVKTESSIDGRQNCVKLCPRLSLSSMWDKTMSRYVLYCVFHLCGTKLWQATSHTVSFINLGQNHV